jgi:hypothetical protein
VIKLADGRMAHQACLNAWNESLRSGHVCGPECYDKACAFCTCFDLPEPSSDEESDEEK